MTVSSVFYRSAACGNMGRARQQRVCVRDPPLPRHEIDRERAEQVEQAVRDVHHVWYLYITSGIVSAAWFVGQQRVVTWDVRVGSVCLYGM